MKNETTEVTGTRTNADGTESKLTTTIEVPVYDTLDEASAAETAARVLELFNLQNRTSRMNVTRQGMVGKPSKQFLRDKAMARMTSADWQAVAGDLPAMNARIDEYMKQIETEQQAAKPQGTVVEEAGGTK